MDYPYQFPDADDYLFSITNSLNLSDSLDSEIAEILSFSEITFDGTETFGSRYNICLATVCIYVPEKMIGRITSKIHKRLIELCEKFLPYNTGYEIQGIEIIPLLDVAYPGWQKNLLQQVLGTGVSNNVNFPNSSGKPTIEYRRIKVRSSTEKKILKAFMDKGVFVIPCCLAVVGNEKKEPDFAVYYKGKFAILDIASKHYHTSIDSDIDRVNWFVNHNISFKQEKASDCYNDPKGVVDRFLKWMEGL